MHQTFTFNKKQIKLSVHRCVYQASVQVVDLSCRPKIIGRCEKNHVVDEGNGLKVRNERGI